MIYLNNAATSYPKPPIVRETCTAFLNEVPGTLSRSAGRSSPVFQECRERLAELFGCSRPDRIFFTSGATDSFNFLFNGLDLSGKKIITTSTEHNSVLRPLFNMKHLADCTIETVSCDENGWVDPEKIRMALDADTAAVIINHCSNVTGAIQDLQSLGEILRKSQSLFLVDASQSGGCIPIEVDEWGIDILVFTGHKSLFGLQGTGGFYIKEGIPLESSRFGGTGAEGLRLIYDQGEAPYEVGTQNGVGIAALSAGVGFILEQGLSSIVKKEKELLLMVTSTLKDMPLVKLYGSSLQDQAPVLSFSMEGISPSDLGYILFHSYHIVLRTGFHCCPLIHDSLNTGKTGTARVSFSSLNTAEECTVFLKALQEIQDSLQAAGPA